MNAFAGVAFGVLADARARRRRRRGTIGAAIAFAAVAAALASGTGGHTPNAALTRDLALRVPAGRASETFTIDAPAGLAYDVRLTAPAAARVTLTVQIGAGAGWTAETGDESACSRSSASTTCLLHFAAGGNPGGRWTAVLSKDTAPAAAVEIAIRFLHLRGRAG